jgi:UDP-glucose 4-epimerase
MTEAMARRFPLRTSFQRDIGELENYFETFARRYPDVTVTMLRYQPSLGVRIESPLTHYLSEPVVPVQLGFDPLLQFVHADDAVAALEAAVRRPVSGPVNVAGEGSISLYRLLRLGGKVPLPVPSPFFAATLRAGRRFGQADLPPEAVPWLRYGLTIDCSRLIGEIGYRPRPTADAVQDFLDKLAGGRVFPDVLASLRRLVPVQ